MNDMTRDEQIEMLLMVNETLLKYKLAFEVMKEANSQIKEKRIDAIKKAEAILGGKGWAT